MMSGNFLARATVIAFALLLGACGGGGSGSDDGSLGGPDNGGGSDGGGGEQTVDVGSVQISASPLTLGTSPGSVSTVRVFVKDSNNRVMTDVPVEFSVNSDAILEVVRDVTDETGTALATLSTATNPANRMVTVSATAGDESASMPIEIAGTTLELSGPSTIPVGSSASYTARLLDSNGDGVAGQTINISLGEPLNTVATSTQTTNDGGEVVFGVNGGTAGSDTITVSGFSGQSTITTSQAVTVSNDNFRFISPDENNEVALGEAQTMALQWVADGNPVVNQGVNFFTTRGTLSIVTGETTTNAQGIANIDVSSATAGPATIEAISNDGQFTAKRDVLFYSDTPTKISVRADKTQLKAGDQTRVRAVLRDAENNLVKNRDVVFNIEQDVSGGQLSGAFARTDSLGRASVVYIAGSGSGTARDGVVISATESESIGSASPIRDETNLTVTDGALRITLGTGNELIEPDADHYTKDWVVFVSNANGEPVENATVELSALPHRYYKGYYVPADCDGNGQNDCWAPVYTASSGGESGCPAEDINFNGIKDPGEDVNLNGKLDPSNDAVVIADNVQSTRNGSVHFQLTYPQSNCTFTEMKIEARATVDGTEFSESATAILSCSNEDLTNLDATPPSVNGGSKYGQSNSCQDSL